MTDRSHAASVIDALRYWHEFMLDAGHKRLTTDEASVHGRDAGWCDSSGYDCAICDVLERQAPLLEPPGTTAGLVPDMSHPAVTPKTEFGI